MMGEILAGHRSECEENHMSAEVLLTQEASIPESPRFAPLEARRYRADSAAEGRNSADVEANLVKRLKQGDENALEALFELHSARLYNVALRILGGDRSETEEVIQDVFLTAFRKAYMFQGHSQFSTWLYRLTVNAALGRIRRGRKKTQVEYNEFLPKFQNDGHHQVRPVVDWSASLDEDFNRQEIRALLAAALNQLKPVDRSVVVLSDLEGFSDKEIAAALNLTVSAVKTRLHRSRLFLRGKLAVHFGHSGA